MKPFLPFIITIAVFVIGWIFFRIGEPEWVEVLGIMGMVCGIAIFIVALVAIPIERASVRSWIQEYEATKQTIAQVRANGDPSEKAALIHKLVEINRHLASSQYWAEGTFQFYWPKEIRELKPLK